MRINKSPLRDSLMLQPWFLSTKTSYAIRRLLPPAQKQKFRDYFAEYGCIRCDVKKGHFAQGFCERCYTVVHRRLRVAVRKRASVMQPRPYGIRCVLDAREARRLLRGFPSEMYAKARSRRADGYWTNNPARSAFIVLNDRDTKISRIGRGKSR